MMANIELPHIHFQPLTLVGVDIEKAFKTLPQHLGLEDVFALATLAAAVAIYFWLVREEPDPYAYKLYERPQEAMIGQRGGKATKDIGEKLGQIGADIVIFWGSQSGTAERMANRLGKEIRQRFGQKALVADVSDYEPGSLGSLQENKFALFIVSTFGEGDPSDNIHDLWNWLDTAKGTPVKNLRYAALGLGNSSYKYFNAVVDVVVAKLDKLGAKILLPVGKADDAQGQTEEHYLEWKGAVFELLKEKMGYEEHEPVYEPALKVEQDLSLEPIDLFQGEPCVQDRSRKASRLVSPVHALPVKATRELFDVAKDRNCIHMELDLQECPGLKYKTGDHLGVWAQNPQGEVDILLRCLGLYDERKNPISLRSLEPDFKTEGPNTDFNPRTAHKLPGSLLCSIERNDRFSGSICSKRYCQRPLDEVEH
ncbi:hypothetical protein CBER1_10582 [Cercospora berteroae]|uniref:Flavodoxin-like domain-containing protein n=1 Tax=Cercospora berteroae TaxID=357750 RepID=A0A2S6BXP5_9PEZI|nr:hypothetical protein CBER1_10582 [Cercospora berteroae]